MLKDRLEREKRGERYSKRQLDKIQPPGFLNRVNPAKPGKEILCVEISISPDHHERISVREGEDPIMIAQIFAAEHGLDDQMRENLQNQLSENVDRYYAVRGTARPHLAPPSAPTSAAKTPIKKRKNSRPKSGERKSGSKSPLRNSYNNLVPVREEHKHSQRGSNVRGREEHQQSDMRSKNRAVQRGMSEEILSDNVSPEPPTERGIAMN